MMCDVGSSVWYKRTTLVGHIDNGGGYAWWGQEVYEKSLYPPLNFAVNLKLL